MQRRIIRFNRKTISFPDGTTDAEVVEFIHKEHESVQFNAHAATPDEPMVVIRGSDGRLVYE